MEKQVELTLTSNSRNLLVRISGFIIIWLVGIKGLPILSIALNSTSKLVNCKTSLFMAAYVLLIVGGFLTTFLVARKFGGVPTLITIVRDELRVLNQNSGKETRILFAAIESYDTTFFNGIEELRLKLRDGGQLKLTIDTNYQRSQLPEFLSVVNGFEAALNMHQKQRHHDEPATRRNEFMFWAKPLATVILWGVAGLTFFMTYVEIVSPRPNGSILFLLYSLFAGYAMRWYKSRSQRR